MSWFKWNKEKKEIVQTHYIEVEEPTIMGYDRWRREKIREQTVEEIKNHLLQLAPNPFLNGFNYQSSYGYTVAMQNIAEKLAV